MRKIRMPGPGEVARAVAEVGLRRAGRRYAVSKSTIRRWLGVWGLGEVAKHGEGAARLRHRAASKGGRARAREVRAGRVVPTRSQDGRYAKSAPTVCMTSKLPDSNEDSDT